MVTGAGPGLSVVLVAYHQDDAPRRCLESLPSGVEVLVVDTGGIDRTGLDGARVLDPGGNVGFAAGCNLAAAEATGEVLVFLNPDTVVAEGALGALARRLGEDGVGIAMARLRLLDRPELLNSRGTAVHLSGLAWASGFGDPADGLTEVEEVPAPSGAAMAIRRELFHELGGFTEELFMYLEDVELGWRARMHGLRVVVDPAADVYHEYEFGRNPWKEALLERNRLVFVCSCYSLRLLVVLAPVLLAFELGMLVTAARGGWLRGKLGGWWWCLSRPRWLLHHRREAQRLRRIHDRELAAFLTPVVDPRMIALPRGAGAFNALVGRYWRVARKML
jgi:GT2 family glycosyltransferase